MRTLASSLPSSRFLLALLVRRVERLESAALLGIQARQALGYKQILEQLSGDHELEEAFERTKILTRRFAKTQRTWLKRFTDVMWFRGDLATGEQLEQEISDHVGRQLGDS